MKTSLEHEQEAIASGAPIMIWESFLPVADPKTSDRQMPDQHWCAARGIEVESAVILLQIRDEVGAVNRRYNNQLTWLSFLIHGKDSGVPCEDDRAYIHLRMKFLPEHIDLVPDLPSKWLWTRKVELSREIAGVNGDVLDVDEAWLQLAWQSTWLLRFLQAQGSDDPIEIVRHTRQFLHFFANMAQMRVA